jgi:D-glycero-alpha-D-manno-heptose-7-phosphate kinase
MLFFTGVTRPAAAVLSEQRNNIEKDRRTFESLVRMTEMARELRLKLSAGDINALGRTLHDGWLLKRQLAASISSPAIDSYYQLAQDNGAVGGKLLGAGGGGFLLLYVNPDDQDRVRRALTGLQELKFNFDNGGTKIIYVGDKS